MKPRFFRPIAASSLRKTFHSSARQAAAACVSLAALGMATTNGAIWTGTTNQDWNTTTNWDVAPGGTNLTINLATGNFPIISATPTFTPVDILVGVGATGKLDQRAGTAATGNGNWQVVGRNASGNGTFNLADTSTTGGTLTGFGTGSGSMNVGGPSTTGGRLILGDAGNSVGTVNMNTTGTLKTEEDALGILLGSGGTTTGNFNLDAGTVQINTLATNIGLLIGTNGGDGNYRMSGGTTNVTGGLWLGDNNINSQGLLQISGGSLNVTASSAVGSTGNGQVFIGRGLGQGTMNVSGSANVTVTGSTNIGFTNTATTGTVGTLTVSGGSFNNSGDMRVGSAQNANAIIAAGTGNFNVTGGTATISGNLLFGRGNDAGDLVTGQGTVSGGTLNVAGDFITAFAGNGNISQFTVSGGTVNVATTAERWFQVNQWDTSRGQVTVSSGNLNLNTNTDIRFSSGNSTGASFFTLSGGAVTSFSGNGTGTATSGVVDLNQAGGAAANNTFNLNGGVLTIAQIMTNNNNGTAVFNFNGGTLRASNASANYVDLGGATQTARVLAGGAVIDSNGYNLTIPERLLSGVAGDGGLRKSGSGDLTLTGVNTYLGATTVNGGSLILSGSGDINTSSGISVNGSGARFLLANTVSLTPPITLTNGTVDGTGTINSVSVASSTANTLRHGNGTAGAQLTINSLSFADAATIDINVNSTSAGIITTNLTTGTSDSTGKIIVNASNAIWLPGTYDLISYTGTIGGVGFSEFQKGTITGLSGRQSATLTNTGSAVALTISGDNPAWTGSQSNEWSTAVISGSKNWSLITSGTPTDFVSGDIVLFDDGGAANSAVNITANVSPLTTTFNNASVDYSLSSTGGFGITSGSVTLNGSGKVAINNANTYAGGTVVNAGTLRINNPSAIGTGPLSLAAFTTIDNTSGSAVTLSTNNAQNWNGDIIFEGTNPLDLGTGAVALSGNRTVSTLASTLSVGGAISGAGFSLTKLDSGTLALYGTNTYSGVTQIKGGTLAVTGGTTGLIGTNIEISPDTIGDGTLSVSAGTVNSLRMIIGGNSANNGAPGAGTLLQSGGVINTAQWFAVGSGNQTAASSASGVFTMTGGTLNASTVGTQNMEIANFAGTTGTVSVSGTAAVNIQNNASIALGANPNAGNGSFTQSGGAVTFYSNGGVAVGGTGALRLGASGTLPATSTYTYDLNGGMLIVPSVTRNAAVGNLSSGIFNFNGGTLKATAANATYLQGLTSANVLAGGALIDDGGFAITIAQPLLSGVSGDGGLTKTGSGTLSLTGVSTYTGATTVNAGTLSLTGAGEVNSSSGFSVNGGGKLLQLSSVSATPTVTVNNGTVDGTGTLSSVNVTSGSGIVANGNGAVVPLTIDSLSFVDAGALNLRINSTSPALITSSLNTGAAGGGQVTVNVSNTSWDNGVTYDLISYGSLDGAGFSEFVKGTVTGLTPRQTATLVNVSGNVALSIVGDNPVWTGAASSEWSTAAIASPKNWVLPSGPTQVDFISTDNVIFNDSATGSTTVDVASGGVIPTSTTFDNSSKNFTLTSSGAVGIAAGPVTKNGTGSVTLGNANTYAGGTTVNNGTLNLNNAGAIGTGALTLNGGGLGNTSAAAVTLSTNNAQNWNGDFSFTGPDNLNMGTGAVTLGGAGSARTITVTAGTLSSNAIPVATPGYGLTKEGAGTLAFGGTAPSTIDGTLTVNAGTLQIGAQDFTATGLAGSGTVENGSGTLRWLYVNTATDFTFSGVLQNGAGIGNLGLNKSGVGTLTLTGANNYGDQTTVNQGKLVFSGTTNNARTANVVGTTAAQNAILELSSGSTFTSNYNGGQVYNSSLSISTNATSAGAVRVVTGSTLTANRQIAVGPTGYAALTQTGGTTTLGGFLAVGGSANGGVINHTGGSITLTTAPVTVGYVGTAGLAVMNLGGTASFNANGATGNGVWIGEFGTATLNVSGSAQLSIPNDGIILGLGNTTLSNGTANLLGGTTSVRAISKGTGTGNLNFNGGVLRANAASATFVQGLTNAYVFSGGAVIDSNGNAITIAQPLLAPTGQGVSASGLSVSGGGYIDTPIVTITGGGGSGATAVASIDGSGNLTGITITNPGVGYTSAPTFALVGGGNGNTGAISGTATLVSNVGGGLTKSGSGTMTLSGANTYVGNTTVNAGTLAISTSYLADAADVSIAVGASMALNYSGTDTVDELTIDGIAKSPGTYGATGSGATNIDDVHFTGTGTLTVTNGPAASAYASWATARGLDDSDAAHSSAKSADPDGDGKNNLYEFAFDGNPLSAVEDGKVVGKVATVGSDQVLTLTLPVRTGATFSGSPAKVSALIDGITYRVEGATDLVTFTDTITEVTGGDATTIQTGLPTLSTGWTYRTFRVAGTVPTVSTDFIRAKVSE
jgi:autotransporter-associated beta strand protein